jgi:hypothetical protein
MPFPQFYHQSGYVEGRFQSDKWPSTLPDENGSHHSHLFSH